MKKFSLGNEERLFIKKEVTEGTLVYPEAVNAILAVGAATATQDDELLEDGQIRARRSRLTPILGRTNPGSWSFTTYLKPSGTPGTAPEEDVLFECGLGKKKVNAGASVVYSLDSTTNLPSFSMVRKLGHTTWWMCGCTVNSMALTASGSAIGQIAWSGNFMKMWHAGESVLTAEVATSATTCVVADSKRFSNEMIKIDIGSDTNSGEGYLVTSINYATNTITFTPGLAGAGVAAAATVQSHVPTTSTEVGTPLHGKYGIVTIDAQQAVLLEASLNLTNNIKYYGDMKNNKRYATIYGAPGFRQVEGTMRMYFYKNIPQYFYRLDNQLQNHLIIPFGTVAGRIVEFDCPRIEYKTPGISAAEEVMAELPFTAVGSTTGDDELTVTWK